jgi:rhodanese-related sulfurtransferase
MGPREAAEVLRRGDAVALDVREPWEWEQGHVTGALHIPMRELAVRPDDLPAETPIVVICRSGNRSGVVARALRANGHDAHNLDGGLKAWKREGLPLAAPGRVA